MVKESPEQLKLFDYSGVGDHEGAGVYVIRALDTDKIIVKIGVTTNILRRFSSILSSSPLPLEVEFFQPGATRSFERKLHDDFCTQRSHGEWFCLDEESHKKLATHFTKTFGRPVGKPHAKRGKPVLGRCPKCRLNVSKNDVYVKDPHARKNAYSHVDCNDLRRRK